MKVLIIGASTTGKTTILKKLAITSPELPLQESDELLTQLNGGTYPLDSKLKMEVLAPTMVRQVLNQDKIIFFTNAHYFNVANLTTAKKKGFKIILLTLAKEEMSKRNKQRILDEGYDDLSEYFDDMILYQKKIIHAGLVDEIINTDQSIQSVISQLNSFSTFSL